MTGAARNGGPKRAPEPLEEGLDHVMRIIAGDAHLQRGEQRITHRTKEVGDEFSRHFSHKFTGEFTLKSKVGAATQIDCHVSLGFIHGQDETITPKAAFITDRLFQSLTQRDPNVFNGVVLVDLKVTRTGDGKGNPRILRDLLKHVVKKAEPGGKLGRSGLIEVNRNSDLRFFSVTDDGRAPGSVD
jgi:hypothetical protein